MNPTNSDDDFLDVLGINGTLKPKRKRAPKKPAYNGERQYLRTEELDILFKAAKNYGYNPHRNYTIMLLSYRHGLRVSEVTQLTWNNIDFKGGYIEIHRVKNGVDGRHPLQRDEIKALRKLYKERHSDKYLFTDGRGTPLTERAIHQIYTRVGIVSGLPQKIHPHMMRHSCGTHLGEKGIDLLLIQAYLGHKDVKSTLVYVQANPNKFNDFWR